MNQLPVTITHVPATFWTELKQTLAPIGLREQLWEDLIEMFPGHSRSGAQDERYWKQIKAFVESEGVTCVDEWTGARLGLYVFDYPTSR